MRTKNFLNISFFLTILLVSNGISAMEVTTEDFRWNSLIEHSSRRTSKRFTSKAKITAPEITTLEDALAVDVTQYESSCADLYSIRSSIVGFLNQITNYTPQAMQLDLEKLESAKSLLKRFSDNVEESLVSFVQLGSKAQLEDTLAVMNKISSMNLIRQTTLDDVKTKVKEYLSGSSLSNGTKDIESLVYSIETVIQQVTNVKTQVDSIDEVSVLDDKVTTIDSLIRAVCFSDVDPVVNITRVDERDPNIASDRYYKGYDDEFDLYERTGVNVTAARFKEYIVAGWIRWLDFIDYSYDHSGQESVIFRFAALADEDIEEDAKFADKLAILYAGASYYRICIHDTQTNNMNLCHTFDYSGQTHENSWHFFMLMYSYNTKQALARIRIDGVWTTYTFPGDIVQTSPSGIVSFYLGCDAFYDLGTVAFNGELSGWNVLYGINSWQSQASMWEDNQAEYIATNYFTHYVDVPYVEILVNPNTEKRVQISDETSLYSFYNTFFEAQDYGFGIWIKLDALRGFNTEERQLVTFAFETRTDITTPGNNIAELYTREGSLFLQVAYERNNAVVYTEKELAALYQDDWFFVQVHFSTTDKQIKAWFQQSNTVNSIIYDDIDGIFVPANVFFTTGYTNVLNYTGADFDYKGIWIYAGVQTLYGQSCDSSCKTCNGPLSEDCVSCNDGFFLDDDGVCQACPEDCATCGGCGSSQCTSCKPGKVLVNGECYCDASCLTCNGISSNDCLSCPSDTQVLSNGRCFECDGSCASCSEPGPKGCTECNEGYQLSSEGSCVPACDTTKCKTCTSDGSQCLECDSPKILWDGDCVSCHESCNTCSGPLEYQCLDCVSPAQFYEGKCVICDETCATCRGPNANDCLTCVEGLLLEGCLCVQPCQIGNGFFRNGSDCLPCLSECQTCDNGDNCSSCVSGQVLEDGHCVTPPPTPTPPTPSCNTSEGYFEVNGECLFCDINNGYVFINNECFPCDSSCLTCNGPNDNNCITCANPDYTLSNGKCQPQTPICNPDEGYVEGSDGSCVPCTVNCTACADPLFLNDNGECVPGPSCDTENGYVVLSDGSCVPCDDTCKTCSDVLPTTCLTCDDDRNFNPSTGSCDVPCDTDQGFVLSNGNCLPCDETCKTCTGPSYLDCIECTADYTMVAGVCVVPCDVDNGYVLMGKQCLPCDSSCKTCTDTSNADCTSCPDGYELQAGSCVVPPPTCQTDNGYVYINEQCVPCDSSCKTCNGVGNNDCVDCPEGKVNIGGACVEPPVDCDIDNGYVLINDVCYPCDATCLTCSGVEATECIDCLPPRVEEGGYCVLPCDVDNGYYKDNGACLPCDNICKTCHGSTAEDCDTCIDGYFQDKNGKCYPKECVSDAYIYVEDPAGLCTSDCDCDGTRRCSPNGECHDCMFLAETFPNNYTDEICPVCHSSCVTCRGPDSDDCWACLDHEFLNNGSCLPCHDTCMTCNGTTENDCTSCDEDEILSNGTCIVPCDVEHGFFYLNNQNCLACDSTCKTCHGETAQDCDTCDEGLTLTTDGECKKPCDVENGYFYDENDDCQPCDSSCLTCSGSGDSDCVTCPADHFLEFGRCIPSACVSYDYIFNETNIAECNSDCECDGTRRCDKGECVDCSVAVAEYPDVFSSDVCPPCHYSCLTCRGPREEDCETCPDGYYFDSGYCKPCDSSCAACTAGSSSNCTECDSAHVLLNGQCVSPCDTTNGYFYNSDFECVPCDGTCKACHNSDADGCDSCYGSWSLNSEGRCVPPCSLEDGYTYDESWNCVPCTSPCSLCSGVGEDQCTECEKGYSLVDSRCVSCVSFYYSHLEADNLNGPGQCSDDCDCDNSRRCDPDGLCTDCFKLASDWPDLYDVNDCPPCNSSCLTCNGPSEYNCTSCVDGEYLGTDNGCYPCDVSCETCDGPGADECASCLTGTFLQNGECVVPPQPCDGSCLECNGPSAQNCTKCGDDYDLVDGECAPKNCIDWAYSFDEANSALGAYRCDDDCECDGTRRCSPDKYCTECLDLVAFYPDQYDLKDCPPCDSSCETCFGPDANNCNSCPNGYYLTADNTCDKCDENCAYCSGTATNCTLCQEGLELEDGKCVIPCYPTCLTCSGPAKDQCDSCPEGSTLYEGQCIQTTDCVKLDYVHDESTNELGPSRCINDCDCDNSRRCSPDHYCRECAYLAALYPTLYSSDDCPPCHETCLTCQGTTADDCTRCSDGKVLIGGKCEACNETCSTCDDVDGQHCTSCASDKILVNGECVNPPPVCDSTCKACSGPNPSDCTECPDDLVLEDGYCVEPNCVSWNYTFVEVDGRCEDDCDCNGARRCSPDKYCQECDDLASEFSSLYPQTDCPPCHEDCATCDGPTNQDCTSCPLGQALVNGECKPCDSSCATCKGTTDSDCTSCTSPEILDQGKCVTPPPECDKSCWTCSGSEPTDCTSCDDGYRLAWDGTCQPIETCCKWGYSHDESTNVLGANRCYDDCDCDGSRRCSPTGYCRECVDLASAYPDQYDEKDCPVCDTTCLTCTGPSDQECSSCADGFVLVDGQCLACNETCVTCSVSTEECTTCATGLLLNGTSCVNPPPECDLSCLNCSGPGANECTLCPEGQELADGYCVPINCVAFDYVHDESQNLLGANRCDDDCDCSGSRRCSPSKWCGECFDLVSEFPTVYSYFDCPACESPCKSCNGSTNTQCTSCDDGYVLVDGQCLPCNSSCVTCQDTTAKGCITCPSGYDLQTDGSCLIHIDCDKTCKTCNGVNSDQCLSCPDGRELVNGQCLLECVQYDYSFEEASNGSCTSDCDCDGTRRCSLSFICEDCSYLDSTYPDYFDSADCPPCDSSCETCRGPSNTDCKSCVEGQYLGDDGACHDCDKGCKTCDGSSNDDCTSCENDYVLENGYCVPPNPVCDTSCLTCNDVGPRNCTSCVDDLELVDGACVPINCYAWDYVVNELLNAEGPHRCENDCDCDGTRVCGPGICMDCLDAVENYPTLFDISLCLPCHESCRRCSGPTYLDCTDCEDNEVLKDGQCFPCDSSCQTCSDVNSNNCVTCPSGKELNSDNECVTPPPVCDSSCDTCFGPSAEECSSCYDEYVLLNNTCVSPKDCNSFDFVHDEELNELGPYQCSTDCDCSGTRMCSPLGYCHECLYLAENFPDLYDSSICPPCNESCATCDGPNADNCLTCGDGYYLDDEAHTCEPCESSCLTCYGPDSNNCLTCESPLVLHEGSCDQPNPVCDTTCLTCTGPLPTDCVTCPDHYELTSSGTCEKIDCIDFDYVVDESTNQNGAHACEDDCDCSGIRRCGPYGYCEDCLVLAEEFPSQFLASDCPKCDESCLLCDGPTERNCTECADGFNLFNGECIQCHEECLTCYGPERDNCMSCPSGQVLYEQQCFTPNATCDPSCVTCSGTSQYECTSCPCDHTLVDGQCVENTITCDESCLTCWGEAYNQCRTCATGKVLLAGECVTLSSFFGMRSHEDRPLSYQVPHKFITGSDVALGTWTQLLSFVPKESHKYNLLFRLSGLTADDKRQNTNKYRFSTLAVYYNATHYTFETYSKVSGTPTLIQKSIKVDLESKWNLVFFGYSRKHATATGFIKSADGTQYEVSFKNVFQDVPQEKMEVFFYGDNVYNGFSGNVASPEVLHGNNFLQEFKKANHETYFRLPKKN